MEKKAKYQQPNQAKGSATDAKKNQDVTSSKSFPKSSRRREPSGANGFPKNDQPRKSNAQKIKNFDKRPKPKGHYHGGSKEDSKVVEDESAELGSVMVQGSKKQNLNHLLNFHYAPRDVQGGWSHGRASGYNSHHYNRWLPAVQRHKYNKEQFLQANCQFVVTAKGDYSLYLNDPDILVDWKLIQQIRVHSSDNLSCPICLCPPVAGKMTRCGHVYCWPCILHYLALSDKSWRKCPICYESIHKSDLKSVVEITENALNIGDNISLRLMRREKGTLIAVPVNDIESAPPSTFLSVSENSCQQVYSKLLLAQNADIMDIIESERVQLKLELLEDPHSPENCFIEQALSELLIREQLIIDGTPSIETEELQTSQNDENIESQNREDVSSINNNVNTKIKESLQLLDNDICSTNDQSYNDLNLSNSDADISTNSQKFYYYYQADGGQNVYLHAMNVKMLEMQYGSLERSPRVISGKLIEKEVGSFTEDLRRRMRYLCHLPVTSQFEIAEIDLLPPLISKEVLSSFEDQIASRQRKRNRREREERKREKKITEEENKRMGKYPTPKVHIESRKHFPQFQPEFAEFNVPSPPESVVASSVASSPTASSFDDFLSAAGADINNWAASANHGPSFAQMLQTNGSRTVAWPSLSTSKRAEPNNPPAARIQQHENIDPEMEEYLAPSYSQSLGDALAQVLEKTELLNQEGRSTDNLTTSSKKKKKKNKATVLFATNMARAS
ncbi:RING finger protein 10 [Nasonia vitripennis]|uniref:E3 ubiquitin-protein ligase RNF10 n=1 Tax=Nasonia vitripennis TaxID=7425 RepID=A0A7M7T6Y4_NASVI|nr:RING finger protein 10 [Nasonia vitripennis]